jgi:hypothetical protein
MLPVLGVPFPDGVEAPSMDHLLDFFGARPQGRRNPTLRSVLVLLPPMHRFLAKIVVTNFWPQARRSVLTLKKATLWTPFCLCKHILHTMLEVHDETNTSLSFGCLITHIRLQFVTDIYDSEPRSRIPDPLGVTPRFYKKA